MRVPGGTTALSAMVQSSPAATPSSRDPAPTTPPGPTTESTTTAPSPTVDPVMRTEPWTCAPAPTTTPSSRHDPPDTVPSTPAGSAIRTPSGAAPIAGVNAVPSTTSREASTRDSGLPTSRQYEVST